MRTPGARLRDKAAAIVALNNVGKQLYAWDKEPDIHQMARAEEPQSPLADAIDLPNTADLCWLPGLARPGTGQRAGQGS